MCHLFGVPVTLLQAPKPPCKKNPAGLPPVEDSTGSQLIIVVEDPALSVGENAEHLGFLDYSINSVSSETPVLHSLLSITIVILSLGNPLAQSYAENAGAGSVRPLTVSAGDTIDHPDFPVVMDWCICCVCFVGHKLIQARTSFIYICQDHILYRYCMKQTYQRCIPLLSQWVHAAEHVLDAFHI